MTASKVDSPQGPDDVQGRPPSPRSGSKSRSGRKSSRSTPLTRRLRWLKEHSKYLLFAGVLLVLLLVGAKLSMGGHGGGGEDQVPSYN
jgi:hypothetical protein